MALTQHPADVEEYRKGYEEGRVLELSGLRQRYSRPSIEKAIHSLQRCAGGMTVYWKEFPASAT